MSEAVLQSRDSHPSGYNSGTLFSFNCKSNLEH
jgi:hypothetical protein